MMIFIMKMVIVFMTILTMTAAMTIVMCYLPVPSLPWRSMRTLVNCSTSSCSKVATRNNNKKEQMKLW